MSIGGAAADRGPPEEEDVLPADGKLASGNWDRHGLIIVGFALAQDEGRAVVRAQPQLHDPVVLTRVLVLGRRHSFDLKCRQ
jgi:hypothetical protein